MEASSLEGPAESTSGTAPARTAGGGIHCPHAPTPLPRRASRRRTLARLAPDDIARYQREGWIVPDHRIPEDRLAHLRGTLDRLIRENPDIRPERLVSIHIEGKNA